MSPNKSPDKLVYMANQIGTFFKSQGSDKAAASSLLHPNVSFPVALVMSIVVTVLFVALAIRKLSSFSVTGETS